MAVHHCIRQLSYCRRDIRDSAGVWGEVSVSAVTYNIQYVHYSGAVPDFLATLPHFACLCVARSSTKDFPSLLNIYVCKWMLPVV